MPETNLPSSKLPASPIEKKLAAGFGIAVLIFLLIAATAAWNAVRFDQTFDRVAHTHLVLENLEQTLIAVLSMQSAARGFMLTGSDDVLEPFEADRETVRQSLADLRRLYEGNSEQQERLNRLSNLLAESYGELQDRIAARRAFGVEAAGQTTEFQRGARAVEAVRVAIRELEASERDVLEKRVRQTQQAARATIELTIVGEVVALAFLIVSAVRVRRDLRERQRAEAAQLQSQRMFQRLFDNAPDAILQVDPSGRLVRANRQAETLFGWERGKLEGQSLNLLIPERFQSRHAGHVRGYFAAPRTRSMGAGLELFGLRSDGSEFPVDILLSPIETDEGIQSLAVIRDVTEQRLNDEKIRRLNLDLQLQNARLEIANKELESFSYSVSHDLRAPLRHIDGFANLLSKHAESVLDNKGRRFVTVISDSARRMGRLIDDLLTFSRMGRAQMALGEVDQQQLVQAVIHDAGLDREGQIRWTIAPLPKINADEAMLRQVWFNLLDNAVKYSSHSAQPHIEVGTYLDSSNGDEAVFFVRDNGVGFDMKYAAKLFGVFQRLHSEAEFEGTGIGLANVRRIVTRHGGRTWAESRLGEGSTFFFSIPVVLKPSS